MIDLQILGSWLLIGLVLSTIFSLIRKEDFKDFLMRLVFVEFVNVIICFIFYGQDDTIKKIKWKN